MSDPVVSRAMEALDRLDAFVMENGDHSDNEATCPFCARARDIAAIREALQSQQGQGEAVGWLVEYGEFGSGRQAFYDYEHDAEERAAREAEHWPARVRPLTYLNPAPVGAEEPTNG